MAADRDPPDATPPQEPVLRLNALVDGELNAAEQAALAAEIAADRDLARAHATLARLKAAVAATADADPGPASAGVMPRRPRWRPVAAAAALAGFVAAGVLAAGLHGVPQPPAAEPSHTVVRASLLPADPVVPDLTVAGLKLAGIAVETEAGAPVVTATYHGPRGCRLELRVWEAGTAPTPPGATGSRTWTAAGLTYALTAFGMPAARFAAVAGAAEHAVRGTQPDSRHLREARAASPPCVG